MNSVYDPLGALAPFIVRTKIIYQYEVRRKVGWDHNLAPENKLRWETWLLELEALEGLAIPRQYMPEGLSEKDEIEFHHFYDASQAAYTSVSYIYVKHENRQTYSSMVLACTKIAPIKTLSLERLELCATVLAAGTDVKIRNELKQPVQHSRFWSDSAIVLQYIKSTECLFQTFIDNRLGTIHRCSKPEQWRHVSSEQNPSDNDTRGLTALELLTGRRVRYGANFLEQPSTCWPAQSVVLEAPFDEPEVNKETSTMTTRTQPANKDNKLFHYYSSWYALQCAVAWNLKFYYWLRSGKARPTNLQLKMLENQAARERIIMAIQQYSFGDDIVALRLGKLTSQNSNTG
ncbi:uncharacterized protein [Palaemon carinicauda]|uniref:uncharacterized protein n=1 Tax=Palaemon carinicauda TaxID=392227 RepID=UPI0035B5816A